ncbi:MAG: hypothetical protein M3N93_01205, partial [Acidobacteriota bacterium]|nr:hypothetical protein [Acidobacteriota bacterium]
MARLSAQTAITTQHNDNGRTGANPAETILTTANVNVSQFGKIFTRPIDGQVYAQPLYLPSVVIPAQGVHNVVYVATEHNTVYAYDADDPGAWQPLWSVNLGPSLPSVVINVSDNLLPESGITSTPVIDQSTGTLYVVAQTYESGIVYFRLHALDVSSGAEKMGGPVIVSGSVPGLGVGNANGVLSFNAASHWQRPGLVLWNGTIYIGFGSHDDIEPYQGWIFGYSASTLQKTAIRCMAPNSEAAGVWQGGVGLAVDSNGFMYIQTGQGVFDANTGGGDYADSVVKLDTNNNLAIADYFTPSNQSALNKADGDFGSSAPILIPGTTLGVSGGKDGKIFLWNRNNLGQYNPTDQVVQEWQGTYSLITDGDGGYFGGNVFYNSTLYAWGRRDVLKAFTFNGSAFNTTPAQGGAPLPDDYSNTPGLSLSANGAAPGSAILWSSYAYPAPGGSDGYAHAGVLRAFDANNVGTELWNSNQNESRDYYGSWAKWLPPAVVNGKVYLPNWDGELCVYGLLSPGSTGSLLGSGDSRVASVNLTAEGAVDWLHWGSEGVNRKANVTPSLGGLGASGTTQSYNSDPRQMSWSDGTPIAVSAQNSGGVQLSGAGQSFTISAPADMSTRTIVIHAGGWNSGGAFRAHISDGSVADFTDTTAVVSGQYDRNYTLTYRAASAGQSLTVSWSMASGAGNISISAVALFANGASVTGSLTGIAVNSTSGVNLTAAGSADWSHWPDGNRKNGVAQQIGNYVVYGVGSGPSVYSNDPKPFFWTDGTPTASASNNTVGLAISSPGKGFEFTVPADTTTRTLAVFVGGYNASGNLSARLSDGSATDFADATNTSNGFFDRGYALTYRAASAGQTLDIIFNLTSGPGSVHLIAAALSVGSGGYISASAGTPQSATVKTAFGTALQVTVMDALGNAVSGAAVTFTAPGSGAGGAFSGCATAVVNTNASGMATAPAFTANSQAGSYTVTASVSGVSPPASFSLTNTAGAAVTIAATAGTPQSATVSTAFG